MPEELAETTTGSAPDAGPLGHLALVLQGLHQGAGSPSLRDVSRMINSLDLPSTASHERVRQLLKGTGGKPSWKLVEAVARALLSMSVVPVDPEATIQDLFELWNGVQPDRAARQCPGDATAPDALRRDLEELDAALPRAVMRIICTGDSRQITFALRELDADGPERRLFLAALPYLRTPLDLMAVVEEMRKQGLHADALSMLRNAIELWALNQVLELIELFHKYEWRTDRLLAAIAELRSPQDVAEVCGVLWSDTEWVLLLRQFEAMRDAGECRELTALIEIPRPPEPIALEDEPPGGSELDGPL